MSLVAKFGAPGRTGSGSAGSMFFVAKDGAGVSVGAACAAVSSWSVISLQCDRRAIRLTGSSSILPRRADGPRKSATTSTTVVATVVPDRQRTGSGTSAHAGPRPEATGRVERRPSPAAPRSWSPDDRPIRATHREVAITRAAGRLPAKADGGGPGQRPIRRPVRRRHRRGAGSWLVHDQR